MICLIIEFIFVQFLLPLKQNSDLSMCFDEEQMKMWRYELKVKRNTKFCDASFLTETKLFQLSRSSTAKSHHSHSPAPEENETWNEIKPTSPLITSHLQKEELHCQKVNVLR
jgi:hypothetical protein